MLASCTLWGANGCTEKDGILAEKAETVLVEDIVSVPRQPSVAGFGIVPGCHKKRNRSMETQAKTVSRVSQQLEMCDLGANL